MKVLPHVSLLLFAVFFSKSIFAQQDSLETAKIKQIVAETKAEYAPDARTKLVEFDQRNDDTALIRTTEANAKAVLDRRLSEADIALDVQLLPDTSQGNEIYGVVHLSVANLRSRPGHSSELATQVLLGTLLDILYRRGGEYRVRTPEGYIAWIPTSAVTPMNADALNDWKSAEKIIIIEEFTNAYSQQDPTSQRVTDLVYGNILAVQDQTEGYYHVHYPDGRSAYVDKHHAQTLADWQQSRRATADNIIQSAKNMLGLPYLWGGTSVRGVDCSGFTKTSFFMNGYIIPRDASQQVHAGQTIDVLDDDGALDTTKALNNLQPADLLFFAGGKANNPNARVTHVALYIGNGEFIHAAGSVRINSMLSSAPNYDDFQTRTLVGARRYIGTEDQNIVPIKSHPSYH